MSKIIVDPFASIIGSVFLWLLSLVKNHGLALILLSVVINLILFPFYHLAETVEKKEKNIQKIMKPKLDEFKSVYKGYELHLYVSNVYRLNDYHPIYALRGLLSLLIQVPFFMGAYEYLSNFSGFKGVSFLFIPDLSQPDALLRLGSLSVNLLPFIMTAINLYSGYIYSKGSSVREKVTIVVIATFFLVVLYNSPSSLLIYWTFNNVFSLVKTIFYELNERKKLKREVVL